MKYNNKNIKSFFWIKMLVLPLLSFVTATEAFIHKMDLLVNKETGQKIICLGDYHEYPDCWKGTENEDIAKTQQTDIIAFAKKIYAIILIETPQAFMLQHFTKEQVKKMFREVPKEVANEKNQLTLQYLYRHCIANNIRCKNVECRMSPNCFDWTTMPRIRRLMKPQEVFDRAQQIAKQISKFNDIESFKKIYRKELNNFNTDCLVLKELLNKLGKHGNTPVNELKKLIKNKQISLSDDALLTLVNFYKTTIPMAITVSNRNHLQPSEIDELINSIAAFPGRFVDMYILHVIAQNKKNPIIIVAGSFHTKNVAEQLQQCGYTVKKSIGEDLKMVPKARSISESIFISSVVNLKTVFNNL